MKNKKNYMGFFIHKIKALQFYKVEAFNVELTKNLNKVVRSTNRITKNSKKDSKVVQPIQMKNCPPNSLKYIDNNIFSIKYNLSLLFIIIYQFESQRTTQRNNQLSNLPAQSAQSKFSYDLFCLHFQNGK